MKEEARENKREKHKHSEIRGVQQMKKIKPKQSNTKCSSHEYGKPRKGKMK